MKKLILILTILLFSILACEDSGTDKDGNAIPVMKEFSGRIEKGALQKGATITASEWSVSGGYSGKVYTTETINNLGGYTISSTELQGILDVRADGFFINENTGVVENTRIILSGLVDSEAEGGNINIITHIVKQRVINLMNSGKSFSEANTQAVTEFYNNLNWIPENPLNTNISTNANLLFLSAAICKNRTVSQVSDILTALTVDMADGFVDLSTLYDSFALVDVSAVQANMISLYGICPNIASVKTQVLDYLNIDDTTIKIITVQPVAIADFYVKTSSGLMAFISGEYQAVNIQYEEQYLGATNIYNATINDFFKIDNTLYFNITADGNEYLYSQTGSVLTMENSLPAKPVKDFSDLIDVYDSDGYRYLTVLDNYTGAEGTTVNDQRIQIFDPSGNYLTAFARSGFVEAWVSDYFLIDSFTYNSVDYGRGIFVVWSNGDTYFHRITSSTPIDLTQGVMW